MSGPRPELIEYIEAMCPGARLVALAGDASSRRFYRVRGESRPTRIVMDYGQPFAGETDDVRLARIFRQADLPVAAVVEVAPSVGCLVLEDLGDRTLESVAAAAEGTLTPAARALLSEAVVLAAAVAVRGSPVLARSERADGPALDADRFRFEMDFFLRHYAGDFLGIEPPAEVRRALHALADVAAATPRPVLCHRDFHSRNLMVRGDVDLAMVDIQDARWGPDTYDLASLIRDAYLEIDEDWVQPLIHEYLRALGESPAAGFCHRFDLVSAQRMLKALGTFGYQTAVRSSRRYSPAIPRTVRRLRRLLPGLDETRDLAHLLMSHGLL